MILSVRGSIIADVCTVLYTTMD